MPTLVSKHSESIYYQYYHTPIGELIIGVFEDQLCLCDWRYRKMRNQVDHRLKNLLNAFYIENEHPIITQTISQIASYFKGELKVFNLPLLMVGTDFQKSVWHQLLSIPFGKTATYLALSRSLNNESAVRAVAAANGANAISIIIPCHRIIGSNNDLVGYAGGLLAKKKLLTLEGSMNQLRMFEQE